MVERHDDGAPSRGTMDGRRPVRFTGRFIVGIALLTLGALWTLDNLGLTDASTITRWWPVLLLVFGVAKILGWGTRQSTFGGSLWLVAGGWLFLHALGVVPTGLDGLWPLALIILGLRFVLKPVRGREPRSYARRVSQTVDDHGRIQVDVVMASAERRPTGVFGGGVVNAVIGNAELDLRGATLAEGRVELEVNAILAGVVLFVPRGWRLVNEVTPVLGNVEDHTERPTGVEPSSATLFLKGSAVMGGIEIRN